MLLLKRIFLFPGVWDLVRIALYIPVSSASSERSFSALRRLKTYLRSTMGQLSNLVIVHIEQEIASKLDYSDIIFLPLRKEWIYKYMIIMFTFYFDDLFAYTSIIQPL